MLASRDLLQNVSSVFVALSEVLFAQIHSKHSHIF